MSGILLFQIDYLFKNYFNIACNQKYVCISAGLLTTHLNCSENTSVRYFIQY